jgi:hypothetical protein
MSKPNIHTYKELILRVSELSDLKETQEAELRQNVREVYEHFRLKNILKRTVKDLAHDEEFINDGFKAAANFVVGKLFDKNSSVKRFITSVLLEKLITPLIKNSKDKIVSFITDILAKHGNRE